MLNHESPEYINPPTSSLLSKILRIIDESKGENVSAIDISALHGFADHIVIVSGRASRHVHAIADRLINISKGTTHPKPLVEGMSQCDWVLLDFSEVIVHILRSEVRLYYDLDSMIRERVQVRPSNFDS